MNTDWHKRQDIRNALNGLKDVFQKSLEKLGYDFEEDPENFRCKWFDKMLALHDALDEMCYDNAEEVREVLDMLTEK